MSEVKPDSTVLLIRRAQNRLAIARLSRPVEELERKAKKARSKSNFWTQEELDLAAKKAQITRDLIEWGRN